MKFAPLVCQLSDTASLYKLDEPVPYVVVSGGRLRGRTTKYVVSDYSEDPFDSHIPEVMVFPSNGKGEVKHACDLACIKPASISDIDRAIFVLGYAVVD